ncbi:MAG TPA: tryptophan--tRNA ligase [Candidatus Absconditabacterales bacterium]|nr:tryptophan--tRNA ligase [Candidatus Absconditabacterales bacterium]HNG97364.1 tryptophan--tRNA ligase [Candidatus Absconditabacterales bacterium]
MTKPSILTGCQATSEQLHIGNYFGAVLPLIQMQNQDIYNVWLFVADLHSITKVLSIKDNYPYDQWTRNLIKLYCASGVDLTKTVVFKQSDVPAHFQLERILACYTHIGFMQRMHAYKDAEAKKELNLMSIGTMNYPILMAADILLYDIDIVPVGKDNQQHMEYCADVAAKFNHRYGSVFKVPKFQVSAEIGEIPGIDGRKMSKSYNNFLGMLDTPDILRKKINKITTTDLLPEDPKDPDSCNVYQIIKLFLTETEKDTLRKQYQAGGMSYKYVKDYLYEKLTGFLDPIQKKFHDIDDSFVDNLLIQNAKMANEVANTKIQQIYKAIGY